MQFRGLWAPTARTLLTADQPLPQQQFGEVFAAAMTAVWPLVACSGGRYRSGCRSELPCRQVAGYLEPIRIRRGDSGQQFGVRRQTLASRYSRVEGDPIQGLDRVALHDEQV